MSSLATVAFPAVTAGSGRVNAQALDGVLAEIQSQVNEIVAVVNRAFGPDARLASGSVHAQALSAACSTALDQMITALQSIYLQADPWTTNVPLVSVPGQAQFFYSVRYRLRGLVPGTSSVVDYEFEQIAHGAGTAASPWAAVDFALLPTLDPKDDDPRFPYPRNPLGTFQWDILSYRPIPDPTSPLFGSAGEPIWDDYGAPLEATPGGWITI